MNIFSSVALGWLGRRVLDWGGWLGTIIVPLMAIYANMTPAQQGMIERLLTGNWQEITLGALIPFIVLIFSQVMSFRATTLPQVVSTDGDRTLPKPDSAAMATIERQASVAPKRKTIWEQITGK